jgi:hypothetical protein
MSNNFINQYQTVIKVIGDTLYSLLEFPFPFLPSSVSYNLCNLYRYHT